MIKNILFSSFIFISACGVQKPFERGEQALQNISQNAADQKQEEKESSEPLEQPKDTTTEPDRKMFLEVVLPMLNKKCSSCHENPADTYEKAMAAVVFKNPSQSSLYQYSTGAGGIHRRILKEGSAELIVLETWINGGTHL